MQNSSCFIYQPRPDLDSELLPGGEEQQRFESFLVREEEEGRAGGWDEREELNYANIAANLGIQIDNGGDGAISLPTQQPSNSRPSIRRHEQVDEVFDFDEAILEERDGEIQHSQQPSYKSKAQHTPCSISCLQLSYFMQHVVYFIDSCIKHVAWNKCWAYSACWAQWKVLHRS